MVDNDETYGSLNKPERKENDIGIGSRRLIFLICLVIAILFWLLIKLSDSYSVEYSFRVNYKSLPDSMRITKVVDSTLDLSLTARGFAILKLNLFNDMDKLDINLVNYSIDHRGGNKFSLYTQELKSALSELINVEEKDILLSKAVLNFEMEETGRREIPVKAHYSINFTEQYDLYNGVEIIPSSVIVYGPKNILDTITLINTQQLNLNNISSATENNVDLVNPLPDLLTFNDDQVTLKFEVEKFTEAELSIPVNVTNLKYEIKTFPSQVKVYYRVSQKDFNLIKSSQFNIVPVTENIDIKLASKLPVKAENYPVVVRNIRIVPPEVEFLIIK